MSGLTNAKPQRSRLVFAIPVVVAALFMSVAYWGLWNSTEDLPSTLIGQQIPDFELPPVQGRKLGLSDENLIGEVSLVNVFASWCVSCKYEHPVFMALAASGELPIYGLNYKDRPEDVAEWLVEMGDPYTRIGADIDGRVSIEWGVYGVPETFVVGTDGRIAYKYIGPVTQEVLQDTIMPIVVALRTTVPAASAVSTPVVDSGEE